MNLLLNFAFLALFVAISADDTCNKIDTCTYEVGSMKIDLSPIKQSVPANDPGGMSAYTFNPCKAFDCGTNGEALFCDRDPMNYTSLIPKGTDPTCMMTDNGLTLTYSHGKTSLTVQLNCTQEAENHLEYVSGTTSDNQYVFVLSSNYACDASKIATSPKTPSTTTSTASSSKPTVSSSRSTASSTKSTASSSKSTASSSKSTASSTPSKTSSNTTPTSKSTGSSKPPGSSGTTKSTPKVTTNPGTTSKGTTVSTPTSTHGAAVNMKSTLSFTSLAGIIIFVSSVFKY